MNEAARIPPSGAQAIHATAVAIGEEGILIRGPSGAGKSTLARALIAAGQKAGRFSRLIGDDRVLIEPKGGRIVVRPHAAIAGLIEIRGQGVVRTDFEGAAVVSMVIDLVPDSEIVPRMPENSCSAEDLAGIAIPRLIVPAGRPTADAAADAIVFLDRETGTAAK